MKKVFISYCWERYDKWVESLATILLQKYDVIFDKWEIKHGNNLDYFMENSIRTVDKVLVICEKEYSKKANERVSGVGIETSIISPKVYRDTKQEKFIPIFLEGIEQKPDYMESILGIVANPNIELTKEKLGEFESAIEGKTILEKPKFDRVNNNNIDIPNKIEKLSIIEKLEKSYFDIEIYNKILKVLEDDLIAKFIVKYQLQNFGEIVIKFEESNQIKILNSINKNYSEATGYGGWENYDLFGRIAYDIAITAKNDDIKNIAKNILEECSNIRWNLKPLFDDFNLTNL